MTTENLRKISIEILTSNNLSENIYRYNQVKNVDDISEVLCHFETYIAKHTSTKIKINYSTSEIIKNILLVKLSNFVRNLDDNMFEKFSALVCKVFGCDVVYATKVSHDQGIDFIGVEKFKYINTDRKRFIIGQSKNYLFDEITVKDIRELAGSILLLKQREFSQKRIVYEKFILRSFTTLDGIFTSKFFFSKSAEELCKQSHILSLDFIDLVFVFEKALLTKVFDISINNSGFDESELLKLINDIEIIS